MFLVIAFLIGVFLGSVIIECAWRKVMKDAWISRYEEDVQLSPGTGNRR